MSDRCELMVSMNAPALGVTGLPQAKCGAPVPRESCPFDNDRHTNCPYTPQRLAEGTR